MTDQLANAPEDVVEAWKRLNPRRRALALALPTAKTKVQAAIDAGYTPKTADKKASALAAEPDVAKVVHYLTCGEPGTPAAVVMQAAKESCDRLVDELVAIGFTDPLSIFDDDDNLLPIRKWPEDMRRALSGIEILEEFQGQGAEREYIGRVKKVKFWDKNVALSTIAKLRRYGVHADKDQPPVQNNYYGVVVLPPKESGRGHGVMAHVAVDGEVLEGSAVRIGKTGT